MINVSVLGYGTVGSGVVEVLKNNRDVIEEKTGKKICVKHVLDLRDFPGDPVQEIITHDFEDILNDDEVSIVVETMGGLHPAYEFVRQALESGKHACTSNKALVAAFGPELLQIARDKKVNFLFEASVGGGIPIIRPLQTALASDAIEEISGILNGTTNYILTKMSNEGSDFATVLKEAQEKGYAEANPEADVEGYDTCRKIAILTSLAYGKTVNFEEIYTEGITKITDSDILYAKKLDAKIKLFGAASCQDGRVSAMVAPVLIKAGHPLFSVDDVFNGILVKGNMVGDLMFYGSGAGKLPTAAAVVSDVIDAALHLDENIPVNWADEKLGLKPVDEVVRRFFVRVSGDKAAAEAKVAEAFGRTQEVDAGVAGEYAFVTDTMTEGAYKEAAAKTGNVINMIRVMY